ncbi:Major facilitator superfamily transporter [Cordyceps militaris CM01]|uniref:Major facilitator superfamily transporter n=1 Tax=Cordyceps militaris (strain CM01) TaxID=983644 RepID=G3JGL5_CORMM|nr:Major facilitator superfamily transporter [Cordyceps militaris CM01]EGX93284.1 Major facilitator superfamily transporter [Cordyceps militaris CM01]
MPDSQDNDKAASSLPMEATEQAPDSIQSQQGTTVYPSSARLLAIGIGLSLAVICSNLDRSILGVATPRITAEFHSLDDIGWYGSAYLLTSCCSQLIFGKIYTRYSIKWVFIAALGIFEVGSILCAATPNSDGLIVGRAIAGLGATGISTGAPKIISSIMPVHQRPKYTAMIGACMGITLVVAPFLGGVFTDKLTWRWCFWINLPLGGLTVLIVLLLVRIPQQPKMAGTSGRPTLDKLHLPGVVLLLASTVSLLLALQWGDSKYAWGSWRCILLLCIFGVCGLAWCWLQYLQGDEATVPPRLLKMRSIVAAMWFAFCLFGIMFIQSYYVPIWFQALKNESAYHSGINLLAMSVAMTMAFILTGVLTTVTGYYVPSMIAGSIISAISGGLMMEYDAHTSTGYWMASLILAGLGFGLGAQQCMMIPQTMLKGTDIALGTSVIMFGETLSGAVFLAVCESLFQTRLVRELHRLAPTANPQVVIEKGAVNLKSSMTELYSPEVAAGVMQAYSGALQPVWIVAVVLGALSLIGAVFTEWVSVKKDKKKDQDDAGKEVKSAPVEEEDSVQVA